MSLLHLILLLALCFALLVALLLLLSLCNILTCSKSGGSSRSSSNQSLDEEEGNSLFPRGNNNNSVQLIRRNEVTDNGETGGLSSSRRPSAPVLTELLSQQNSALTRATSRQSVNSHRPEDIRAIQTSLIRNELVHGNSEEGETENYNLIIGMATQPTTFGAYCVNVGASEKWVEFYSINKEDLPWRFGEDTNDTEMEAKNFLFALMLWSNEILDARRILIYAGNHHGVNNYDSSRHGRRATKLMEHYSQCEGVVVGNDCRFFVNCKNEPKSYAEHIRPAEDLADGNLRMFHDFLEKYYEVSLENFRGSHYIPPFKQRNEDEVGFERVNNYGQYIEKVREAMRTWTEPCPKCGYVDDETASMLSINRIP